MLDRCIKKKAGGGKREEKKRSVRLIRYCSIVPIGAAVAVAVAILTRYTFGVLSWNRCDDSCTPQDVVTSSSNILRVAFFDSLSPR